MPMQDVKKTDMKSETNEKRIRRRNRWLPLYIIIVLVLTAGVGVALSTSVFFNVETIVVTGEAQQYTVTEIVKAADVCSGDNLIKLDTDKVAKNIYDNLIYIETVTVEKKFPDELVIDVQKCRESYNIVFDNGILLASATGKIISNSVEAADDLPVFYGYLPAVLTPGEKLSSQDEQKDKIFYLFTEIMSRELSSPITSVDMTDKYDIRVCFDDRIIFDLGNWNELEYKITLAETVIDRLGIDKTGYLTMIGNNQCAFRDSSLVDDMDPIKSTVTTTATDTTSDTDTQTTTTATTAAATTETTEESAEEETTAAENP
jgi:cell division protein FtsQ